MRMRRLIIIAFLFMNLCLPMGTQASNGGNVSPASHATNIQCLAYLADMEQTE